MSGPRLGLCGSGGDSGGLTAAGPYRAQGDGSAPLRTAAGLMLGSPGAVGVVLVVYGVPAPQGSKSAKSRCHQDAARCSRCGRAHLVAVNMIESSKKVAPWRTAVARAGRAAMAGWAPLDGPLAAVMVFTLARNLGHFGTGRNAGQLRPSAPAWPDGYPDADKLARSTGDALKTAGVIADDARICVYDKLAKSYPGGHPDALSLPGAYIKIRQL